MPTMKQDMVTLKGRDDVGHIPYQPFWLFIVRCFQLLLAIIILGLSAYAGSGYFFVRPFRVWLTGYSRLIYCSMLDMELGSSLSSGLCFS